MNIPITLNRLTKTFQAGGTENQVLKDITLKLISSESTAIVGTSGSGKSTLLSIIGTLDRPTNGSFFLGERDVSGTGDQAIHQWVREALTMGAEEKPFDSCVDRFARILISEALNLTGGNRSQAAKLLGLSRPTLHSKIEKYGLKLETSVKEE